ncbi:MAG: endonuclease III, partial [Chloroflexia bacterium]|nr:endonuclease III [Chloroflexia bacterium]
MNSDFPIVATLMQLQTALIGLPQPLIDQMQAAGPFKVLIATLLSLRTRDDTTAIVAPRLFAVADTPQALITLGSEKIAQLIYPVGFYRTKARDIVAICQQLITLHAGDVPADMQQLLALPGVGRKTANLVLAIGFGIPAICVDIHVHRICNRWGYLATTTPEETEQVLRQTVPSAFWIPINGLLVTLGQQICHPTSPRCSLCPVRTVCA